MHNHIKCFDPTVKNPAGAKSGVLLGLSELFLYYGRREECSEVAKIYRRVNGGL